nr:ShlB/FhaC/HecB family hemolysin secretion/activation protein [uncultured Albidiferax sp.]
MLPAAPVQPNAGAGASTQTTVVRFQLEGNTLVDAEAIQNVLSPWRDRPVSLADLRQATAAVEDLYRQRGWLARVSLPGQDITDGTVRFTITESRLGRILLQQSDRPLAAALSARAQALLEYHLHPGQPLSVPALERALLLADDIPGVRVNGSLQASDIPDSTDVVVVLSASVPYRGEASLDNGGHRATGSERATAELRLLSPWGQGEQINLKGSVSRGSQFLGLGSNLPVGNQGWRIALAASALRYQVLEARNTTTGLPPEGAINGFVVGAHYPLVRSALSNWQLSAGMQQTQWRNRDDNQALGVLDTASRGRSRTLELGLVGNQFDQLGGGGANNASLALTHGRLSLDGSPIQFADAYTVATQGSYSKLRWTASRLQTLSPGLSLLGSATGQFASANLDASEKLYLGGMNGVRAYPNAEGGGSTGTQATLELRQDLGAQWQASAFYDWGQIQLYKHNRFAVRSSVPLVDPNRITLQGAGLALTWRGGHGVQIQGTWARRMGSNPLATPSGADTDGSLHQNRFWLNASIAF